MYTGWDQLACPASSLVRHDPPLIHTSLTPTHLPPLPLQPNPSYSQKLVWWCCYSSQPCSQHGISMSWFPLGHALCPHCPVEVRSAWWARRHLRPNGRVGVGIMKRWTSDGFEQSSFPFFIAHNHHCVVITSLAGCCWHQILCSSSTNCRYHGPQWPLTIFHHLIYDL